MHHTETTDRQARTETTRRRAGGAGRRAPSWAAVGRRAERAIEEARAALLALGIDPDAAETPGLRLDGIED